MKLTKTLGDTKRLMREITIITGANPLIKSCCQVSEHGHFLRSNSITYLKIIAVKTIEITEAIIYNIYLEKK